MSDLPAQAVAPARVHGPTRRRVAVTARRTARWWRARPTLAAATVYAVLAILMVGQGLLPGRTLSGSDSLWSQVPWASSRPADVPGLGTNFELADAANVFQPFLRYTREQLPGIPLWNPYIMAGRPFLADGQSAVFSPFSIPSYVLPFWKSLAVVAMLKLFLGGFGTYLLGRALGMRFGGALLAGVVFAFGTFFIAWIAWGLGSVYALIPWALLLTELVVRRPGPLPAAGLAAVLALSVLAGHPESTFHLSFVTVAFFAFGALVERRRAGAEARALGPSMVAFGLALVGAAGLSALVLGPLLEFLFHSADYARRASTPPSRWPRKYIGALFLHDYWGRPTQLPLESFTVVRGWYAGALTLMLASAALLLRRTAERIGVALFAAFCVCMVLGIQPVFGVMTHLPGFKTAHNERLLIYFLLALGLLAGWGLDDLSSRRIPAGTSRKALLATAAIILCIPIVWMAAAGTLTTRGLGTALRVAWGFAHPPAPPAGVAAINTVSGDIVRSSALLIWLPLAGAGLLLIALRLRSGRRLPAAAFVAVAVALVAADLFRANMGYNPAIRIATASQPATGSIRYLQSRRPNRFVGVSTLIFAQPLPADLAMTYGLYDARGYDFPVAKRFDRLWRRSVAPTVGDFTQPVEFASGTAAAVRALNLFSVSDFMTGPGAAPPAGPDLRVAYRGPDATVYANGRALPRVFVVYHQHTVSSGQAALDAVTGPGFDGRGIAVTERPVAGIAQARAASPAGASKARFISYGAEHVTVAAQTPRRGLLILTDSYFPGWKATVDGRPAKIEQVDYVLRGVALDPGRHRIEFRYQPASWRIGWIVSLLSLLAVVAVLAAGWWRHRRSA